MIRWPTRPLREIVELQRGHDLPSDERRPGSVPIIGSFGVTGYHDVPRYAGPGVGIGRSGASIGKATYVADDYWPLNTCLFVKDFKGNDPRWVYWLLDQIDFDSFNSGSAQPSLNRNFITTIPVTVPPLVDQAGIAEVLGSLSQKVASNIATAATVWSLAETEFEAIQASAPGRQYQLRDIAALEYGKPLPAPSRRPGQVAVVGSGGHNGTHAEYIVGGSGVVVGRKGSAGSVHWVSGPHYPIDTTFYVRGVSDGISQPYLYFLLRTLRLDQMNNDSAVPGLNRSDALALPINVPNPERLREFTRKANELIQLAEALAAENEALAAMREAILPHLMSGTLRVRDI